MAESQAIVPPHLTVRVICAQGHLLPGLFLVFKLKPRAGGNDWDTMVSRVMEGTDPGDAPVDPSAPPAASSGAPAAAPPKKSARTKGPGKPTPEKIREYVAAHAAWSTRRANSLVKPPDPAGQFVVGFVDDEGYLVPVHAAANPWYDTHHRRDPDAYKLGLGEVYQACLLRHPDPALARAVARHLNGAPTADDAKYDIGSWGRLLRDVRVELQSTQSGDQYVFKLSETPGDYHPPGPARYGGWSIYLDMPHAMCAGVPSQLEKLERDLARMRYPIGQRYPFKTEGLTGYLRSTVLDKRVRFAAEQAKDPELTLAKAPYMHEHVRYVHSQIVASIGGFQEHLRERKAFALSHKDAAYSSAHGWPYVLGTPFEFQEGSTDPRAWRMPRYLYLGVVDRFTASMIEHWERHGLRKPGSVMVESATNGSIWMQERAAVAVDAWSMVLGALGVNYAVPLRGGSSFRYLVDNPWPGSIKASLHNSGFAIDLAGGGKRTTKEMFPIRFEADWVRKKKGHPGDQAKVDLGNLEYNLYFRLYAHSELDVFGSPASAVATARANLTTVAGNGRGSLAARLRGKFTGVDDPQIDTYVAGATAGAVAYIQKLIAAPESDLVSQYFRSEVRQFLVNNYEADAGTSMPAHRPTDGGDGFPAVSWAKSWINITSIAYPLGMERIGAHQSEVRDQTFYWGAKHKKAAAQSVSMLTYMKGSLVALLEDISAPPDESAENAHYADSIPLKLGTKKDARVVMEVKVEDLERDFLGAWRNAVGKLPARFQPQGKPGKSRSIPTGAQVRVVLSALPSGDPKKDPAKEVEDAAAMFDRFASQRFIPVHSGALVNAVLPADTILTGAELAGAIRSGLEQFQRTVRERWAREDAPPAPPADGAAPDGAAPAAPPAPKQALTRQQARKKQQAEAQKRREREKEVGRAVPDWTVVLQPVFVRGSVDPANPPFMPQHAAVLPSSTSSNHLEWWHYQHRNCGANWGAAVRECGYSHTILDAPRYGRNEASPIIHRGAGFQGELDNKVGSINAGQPGNTFVEVSGG